MKIRLYKFPSPLLPSPRGEGCLRNEDGVRAFARSTKYLMIFGLAIIIFSSCEKIINPTLQPATPVLVVDAWLNNKPEKQIVRLTMTQSYFDATVPPGVHSATVLITDDLNTVYSFADDGTNTGTYQWTPAPGKSFGAVGRQFKLTVQLNSETFEALSVMKRTTAVDSITFLIDESPRFPSGSYQAQFWGNDLQGKGDSYWIKTYKNGVQLNKPSEINLAFDAGFSQGGDFDGVTFITPIRRGVNPDEVDANKKRLPAYVEGDSLYVEINSITLESFDHLQQVKTQTERSGGFGALFAKPLDNVSTNIVNTNANGSKVVGFFNVSAVKGRGRKFVK